MQDVKFIKANGSSLTVVKKDLWISVTRSPNWVTEFLEKHKIKVIQGAFDQRHTER